MPRMTRAKKLLRGAAQPGWADRGGIAVIVSILLAAGVLLGMAALSVDVGQLTAEREELMSAADGAAQDIAIACAKNTSNCATSAALDNVIAQAQGIANQNGKDNFNDVTVVCGHGGALAPCDPTTAPTNLTACLNTPPTNINYVEVRTATRTSSSSTVLPTAFAGSFVPGYRGGTVGACSRVEWGSPGGGLSLTFAHCEWDNATSDGSGGHTYYPFPPDPPATAEKIIYLHGSDASSCTDNPPSGWDAAGGFGWLDQDSSSSCYTTINPDGTYPGNTGSNVSAACMQALADARASRQPVLIPVYEGVQGTGANATYLIAGVAAFVVTGYYFNGSPTYDVPSWLTGQHWCSQNDKCVYGFFVSPLLDASVAIAPGGSDFGPTIIKTVG